MVIYIHGDGDYLYHTNNGSQIYADKTALQKARSVAKNMTRGNVIIFHRQSKKSFLGLFPRKTSQMYVYQNGEQQLSVKYRKKGGSGDFMHEEKLLFKEFALQEYLVSQNTHFFYFGHEIPNEPTNGYHKSDSNDQWGTELFVDEIKTFLPPDSDRFGLIALSTCNNGTPEMAHQLLPIANTLLASPGNLHLSHLDLDELLLLERRNRYATNSLTLARRIASDSFSRLSNELLTEVTLAVYDLKTDESSLDELKKATDLYEKNNNLNYNHDNIDCSGVLPADVMNHAGEVNSFFKPARFGVGSDNDSHSGWGCKPVF